MATIDYYSTVPLYLIIKFQGATLGTGTGFAIKHGSFFYLVTNWHNVTGRNFYTKELMSKKTAAIPDRFEAWFHGEKLGEDWLPQEILLLDGEDKKWIEHPSGDVDVVLIPFSPLEQAKIYDLDLSLANNDLIVYPSEPVSIIGYPDGLTSHSLFPIWKTAHIASDIEINYLDRSVFLIDGNTRQGMSGSPVIAKRVSMYQTPKGNVIGNTEKFLGIYSGRIHDQAGIGTVWKPNVISEIFESNNL